MSEHIRVVARFAARPDRVEDVKRILSEMVGPTRREYGCITYELLQNAGDPTDFTFVEEWTSKPALDEHARSPHIQTGRAALEGLLQRDAEIAVYNLVI
ncbi:MAG: putative quinol monooxygenase [Pyrinomonadaceae bacterium]